MARQTLQSGRIIRESNLHESLATSRWIRLRKPSISCGGRAASPSEHSGESSCSSRRSLDPGRRPCRRRRPREDSRPNAERAGLREPCGQGEIRGAEGRAPQDHAAKSAGPYAGRDDYRGREGGPVRHVPPGRRRTGGRNASSWTSRPRGSSPGTEANRSAGGAAGSPPRTQTGMLVVGPLHSESAVRGNASLPSPIDIRTIDRSPCGRGSPRSGPRCQPPARTERCRLRDVQEATRIAMRSSEEKGGRSALRVAREFDPSGFGPPRTRLPLGERSTTGASFAAGAEGPPPRLAHEAQAGPRWP